MKEIIEAVLNKTLEEAREIAGFNGYSTRVYKKDEQLYILTQNFKTDRINFEVENNIVIQAKIG